MSERDLAEAIYEALASAEATDAAFDVWQHFADLPDRAVMQATLRHVATTVIAAVLARRQCEAARTGPQEELGTPGSLLSPKRGAP